MASAKVEQTTGGEEVIEMTKKHFISLADALRGAKLTEDTKERLCNWMASQNHAFMRGRWLSYLNGDCGQNGGKVK